MPGKALAKAAWPVASSCVECALAILMTGAHLYRHQYNFLISGNLRNDDSESIVVASYYFMRLDNLTQSAEEAVSKVGNSGRNADDMWQRR